MLSKLEELQREIYNYELKKDGEYYLDYSPKISFFKIGDYFDITYFGDGFDDDFQTKANQFDYETNFAFCSLLDLLSEQSNSEKVIALRFEGADQGANGTKSWNFDRLLGGNTFFPNLKNFYVQLTDLGDHNTSIIDRNNELEENGIIGELISRMPSLNSLTLPSAPDKTFFEIGNHPLKFLKLQAGYNHQNFIENFSESNNFSSLTQFDYTDLIDFYDIPNEEYTSFESYLKLFKSKSFSSIQHFKLRNAMLSQEQLFDLQNIKNVQFLNIRASGGRYVSHLMNEK